MLVREVMSGTVVTVRPDTTVRTALELLARHDVSSLPVLGADGALVGVVGETDLLRRLVPLETRAHLRSVAVTDDPPDRVEDVMLRDVPTVGPAADVAEALRTAETTGARSVPVVDDGVLVGVVSRSDVVRSLARSDAELGREVAAVLRSHGQHGWDVTVDRGTVRLAGPVEDPEAGTAAVLAATVPGVVRVHRVPTASGPLATDRPAAGG